MSIEPDAPPHPANIRPAAIGAPATPVAAMASQATAIEATRAVAEVQALVTAAKMLPRVPDECVARMLEVCADAEVIANAFWSFRRSGHQLTGPTVQLMRALAQCWGNVTHGTDELRRDDVNGISEMQAWAWDLEANYRVAQKFIVPHRRDKDGGRSPLTSDRDVYENNASQAARREREMIRRVLPPWFVAQAVELCQQGVQGDPAVPVAMRVAKAVATFGDTWGVRPDQLESWLDAPRNDWTVYDLARLTTLGSSIHRGETTARAEFPHRGVTGEELVAQSAAMASQTPPAASQGPVGGYAPDDPARPFTDD